MAGKRDEVFLLGEEEVGADPWGAPEEEPTATAPVPGPSRSPRLRVNWPLTLGGLALVVALAFLARPGGDGAAPAPPRAGAPAVVSSPEAAPIARASREADRPHRVAERQSQQPRPGRRHEAAEEPGEPASAPLAEAASGAVITYAPAPEAAPEPAPEEAAAAPTQAAPLRAARPEFGIER
jgi:hypothetical protein